MRSVFAAIFCLLLVTPAVAEQWQYEGGGTPIAWFDNGEAQFQFACRGGQLTMAFWVRKPADAVGKAAVMSLALTPDGGGAVYAQDMPLVQLDGASVIVRGPVARQWARIAQGGARGAEAGLRAGGRRRDGNLRRAGFRRCGLEIDDRAGAGQMRLSMDVPMRRTACASRVRSAEARVMGGL